MKYIYAFSEIDPNKSLHFGGKAESLAVMAKAGLPVHDGYGICAAAFENDGLSDSLRSELSAFVKALPDGTKYAVRSSAVGEDGKENSFAGAYETVLNVDKSDIIRAVETVAASAANERVAAYSEKKNLDSGNIAADILRMYTTDIAGLIFTSDPITGSAAKMNGNFVRGVGESLVSGESNAELFSIDALKYHYDGSADFSKYAKKLCKCAVKIKTLFGSPQDIEWAVADGKIYILQARPIRTLNGRNADTYVINDTLCGELLLSKTNVGEIFMRPVSPATQSIINSVFELLGIPLISNVCGQLYCNISGVCSLLVSFGFKREKAYRMIADIAGKIPDGTEIPIYPFDKKAYLKKVKNLAFPKEKQGKTMKFGKNFSENMGRISDELAEKVHNISDKSALLDFWNFALSAYMVNALKAIVGGVSVKPLLKTRAQLEKIAGEKLADELLSDCCDNGTIESLMPLLAIDDIISGKLSKSDYISLYGHRHADEMELSCPYPYENPDYLQNMIDDYKSSGISASAMKSAQEKRRAAAVGEFERLYPSKKAWLQKLLKNYSAAVYKREKIRSHGVKLFCLQREFLLKAAELTDIGDDVFMLYFTETLDLLRGDTSSLSKIPARRENYEKYRSMPAFPNIICGRFNPEEWINTPNRRSDFCKFGESQPSESSSEIRGIAGSAGIISGTVRVLNDISESDLLQNGEILVTTAANIGWVKLFPKISAIVTDIGAPLSHAVIVARELGIPAVVGCGNAVDTLKTGDTVTVVGTSGRVFVTAPCKS